jgi:hypothetical protein
MVDALACLKGVRSLIIDGELVAYDGAGGPIHLNPSTVKSMHHFFSSVANRHFRGVSRVDFRGLFV